MQQNQSGRLALIFAVLLLALWAIFPSLFSNPVRLLNPAVPFSQKHNLKPGIDMVGGTSLLYEIKPPAGSIASSDLAQNVMEALKKRVDPDGVRNLIWRPQGSTRLEIQMPLTSQSGDAQKTRDAFAAAQRQLDATNVRPAEVIRVVETGPSEKREETLKRLAGGSERRDKLFGALRSAYDGIQDAKKKRDAETQARREIEYESLKKQIDETNLTIGEMQGILGLSTDAQKKRIDAIKLKFADFPARLTAIDAFLKAARDYETIKGAIDDATDLKRLLKGSGVLEFHILMTDFNAPEYKAMVDRLKAKGPRVQAGDTTQWFQVDHSDDFHWPMQDYNEKKWALVLITPEKSMTNRGGRNHWALEKAYPTQGPNGATVVGFRFDAQGATYFSELTGANLQKPLAITLDEKLISAPNINSQIGRDGIIEGGKNGYSRSELNYLISTMNAGSLPAQLAEEPISERTVGPQLGEDNLRAGLIACGAGLVVVAVFLVTYYYLAGIVAFFAVVMNVILILGTLAALNATFTLPGIAAIVLTIGAAVDANVLIFERLREEQHRGLSLRMALRNAYDRAWSAIVDSNMTTAITSAVLYLFGSEEVKGFGLTLLIGLAFSMFTALFVTRTIFNILIDGFGIQNLSSLPLTFPKWDKFLRPNIDWMSKAWMFFVFSAIFIVAGMIAFVVKVNERQMMDIEFASGTAVQFELKQPMHIDKVRGRLHDSDPKEIALPSPSVYSVGAGDKVYEVVTPNADRKQVQDAVLAAFKEGELVVEVPSTFEGHDQTIDAVLNKQAIPIQKEDMTVGGFKPQGTVNYLGGVAIVLSDLNPPLKPSEIESRLKRQSLQPLPGQENYVYPDFAVVSESGNDEPTKTAVILAANPSLPYEQDQFKWQSDVAGPMWKLANDAVNKQASLQKISNFDAQVAGDAQRDALLALVVSMFFIMIYIWLRFGNLKYGTATVVALLHDTIFTIAALGFAHYIADTWFGHSLLIEPFRINLTVVAGILTIMGYSMVDTIVVFDRIRENRGKYGHVDRKVINDAINQTLSRTLLTAGTTLVTVTVMYVWGGPGIHGFTFVLLIGILVGTYSSIAIASPILLLGSAKETASATRKPAGQLQRA